MWVGKVTKLIPAGIKVFFMWCSFRDFTRCEICAQVKTKRASVFVLCTFVFNLMQRATNALNQLNAPRHTVCARKEIFLEVRFFCRIYLTWELILRCFSHKHKTNILLVKSKHLIQLFLDYFKETFASKICFV